VVFTADFPRRFGYIARMTRRLSPSLPPSFPLSLPLPIPIPAPRHLLALLALLPLLCHAALSDCDSADDWRVLQAPAPHPAQADAAAVFMDRQRIRWPGAAAADSRFALEGPGVQQALTRDTTAPRADLAARHAYLGAGVDLRLQPQATRALPRWLQGPLWVTERSPLGDVRRQTALQTAGALDDLYAAASSSTAPALGARPSAHHTDFRLWAPTARRVALCLHDGSTGTAAREVPLKPDARTGIWSVKLPSNLSGSTYTYLVDVQVRQHGLVRNRVTDPYSFSLNANSRRSWVGHVDAPNIQPAGWANAPRPAALRASTDMVIYELHVRDFSAHDASVPPALRGKYAAFTQGTSAGMRHLQALAQAGVTDLHLLPVFDFATVPERGCTTAAPAGAADSPAQQAAVMAGAATDCYNWGYDPLHFGAPEGSYASDADDGAVRVREFRQMVMALHAAGLRVGMDLVYNHLSASGQHARSVLDRTVPGYYHRLDAKGDVTTSTCCANSATEHRMMERLMIDTAVTWARNYRIDSFRFDLMGHQPRAAMERLQKAVDQAAGRHVPLIGEGWNFGEIANGQRFVQASQLSLNGSGIASFSDRGRDAARGGGCCDGPADTAARPGWLGGGAGATPQAADLLRLGLAGTLRSYRFTSHTGQAQRGEQIDYTGQPAGFASQPGEVVNYVENHDNQTLFDLNTLKLPRDTSSADRARVQVLGLALTAFSQGVAYFHAGVDILRSKSGDRDSFDSGDWFNRLDWTATDNGWGSGLPPEKTSAGFWPLLQPLLADASVKPTPGDIAFTRDAFRDLLKIRTSSSAFRLTTADEVQQRLTLLNTGPDQQPTLLLGHLDARGLTGGGFAELLFAINAGTSAATLSLPTLRGRGLHLHPVHLAASAADPRPARESAWLSATGTLTVPPRTALVYVAD
jgi:pullulanase/glycogen debranching enzyme